MRVLHIYAGNLYGGVESALATLAREREQCPSMHPHFALCFEGRLARELRDCGAPHTMLGEARISRPWTVAAARRRLGKLLKSGSNGGHEFDVAICHSYWPHALFAPVVRSHGIPLVYWSHDVPTGRGWLERLARRTPPDVVLANSEFTARAIHRIFAGVPVCVQRVPISSVPAFDTIRARRELRESLGCREDAVVVVLASRLDPMKGHLLLLHAIAQLRDLSQWECWIAGAPQTPRQETYLATLKQTILGLGVVERFRFLGTRDDIPHVLVGADLMCQPNISPDAFGLSFVEAMRAGIPVITTNLGAAPEIVTPDCGRLVAAEARSLAVALKSLIESAPLRKSLGAGGQARAALLCDVGRIMHQLYLLLTPLAQSTERAK